MKSTRRNAIRNIGLTLAGLGLSRIEAFALPDPSPVLGLNDNIIRLSSNENPYGASPAAYHAMKNNIGISNRYQWQMIRDLMAAIAGENSVKAENVLVAAGSTRIIDSVISYASGEKGNFIVAHPTFDRWAGAAEKLGLQKIAIPLTSDKKHNLHAMLNAITPETRLIYLCNPNNPTGTVCDHDELVSFVNKAAKKTLVLVDEAYLDYSEAPSLKDQVAENENLVIVKTFSKIYGLAGARIGYALAQQKTIERMGDLQSGANMDVSATSLAAALATLNNKDYARAAYVNNEKVKAYTMQQLKSIGIPAIPSHTNFIYFSLANYKKDFFALLKANNIQGTEYFEEEGKWTRITIGTMDEMEQFVRAIA